MWFLKEGAPSLVYFSASTPLKPDQLQKGAYGDRLEPCLTIRQLNKTIHQEANVVLQDETELTIIWGDAWADFLDRANGTNCLQDEVEREIESSQYSNWS